MRQQNKQRNSTVRVKTLEEITVNYNQTISSLFDLRQKFFDKRDNNASTSELRFICGDIATKIDNLVIESGDGNTSLLLQLGLKDKTFVFNTKVPEEKKIILKDKEETVLLSDFHDENTIIYAKNFSALCAFRNGRCEPAGEEPKYFEDEKIPISHYFSRKVIIRNTKRRHIIAFFRNNYGSHYSKEYESNFGPDEYPLSYAIIGESEPRDVSQELVLECTLIQILNEILLSLPNKL